MSPSANNADVVEMLREMQSSGNLTPQQEQWIRQQIMRLGGTATTTPTLLGSVGAAGNAITGGDPRLANARGLGAGIGLGLSALLRKYRKKPSSQPEASTLSDNPDLYQPAIAQQNAQPASSGSGPDFSPGPVGATPPSIPTPDIPGAQLPPGPGLWTASGNSASGNLISHNGKDWFDQRTGEPFTDRVANVTEINDTPFAHGGRARRAFARGGQTAEDLPPEPAKPMRAVLVRKPGSEPDAGGKHFPIPVISTTIVIAHHKPQRKAKSKLKPETRPAKKAAGGPIKPRRPAAVPPTRGPGNGTPAPFAKGGHVQVPRGSGCATRGKKFGGIY